MQRMVHSTQLPFPNPLNGHICLTGRAVHRDNQPYGGPGSVVVSEIDLSSPLNYGTPSSHGGLAGVGSQGSVRTPGVRGTPIRVRSDIQSERRLRQVVT